MAVKAELVKKPDPRLAKHDVPEPDKFELYTKPRRAAIIEALTPNETDEPEKYRPGSFLKDAARHAGVSPYVVEGWLAHGEQYPNGPLGRFNREVLKLIAKRNDMMQSAIWDLAHKSKRWEGIARLGEQADPDTWARPKDDTPKGNTTIIDKLLIVHGGNQSSLTGD